MQDAYRLKLAILYLALGTGPALGHPGDHSHFDWHELAGHLLEPDHLVFLALIVLVGVLAFRAGRKAERRACERNKP